MNISIFGLGYVGTVSAACLARRQHSIIGVDTSETKVRLLKEGHSPIVEPGIETLLKDAVAARRLDATSNALEAVRRSEISLLCVGTPSSPNGSLNLEYIFGVAREIGAALREKKTFHAIAIRSTVLPGTVDRVIEIVERESGKKPGVDFGVGSNPEFLREGSAVNDFDNPPFTIIGSDDPQTIEMLNKVYEGVPAPVRAMKTREAEILKYACNAFHAVKVTFANEVGAICKEMGIDSHAVMDVFVTDTRLNISPMYLKPGFAFGGSCLPKDVRALAHAARSHDVPAPLVDALIPSNKSNIQRVIGWVQSQNKKRIGVLGLSFKSGTDDMRESPIVEVIETLLGKGYAISIYDANVNLARLIGANKRYIEQEIPHISSLLKPSLADVLDSSDVILVANGSPEFADVPARLAPGQIMLDLVRVSPTLPSHEGMYDGIAW